MFIYDEKKRTEADNATLVALCRLIPSSAKLNSTQQTMEMGSSRKGVFPLSILLWIGNACTRHECGAMGWRGERTRRYRNDGLVGCRRSPRSNAAADAWNVGEAMLKYLVFTPCKICEFCLSVGWSWMLIICAVLDERSIPKSKLTFRLHPPRSVLLVLLVYFSLIVPHTATKTICMKKLFWRNASVPPCSLLCCYGLFFCVNM